MLMAPMVVLLCPCSGLAGDTNPSAILESEFIFEQASFPSCHASAMPSDPIQRWSRPHQLHLATQTHQAQRPGPGKTQFTVHAQRGVAEV